MSINGAGIALLTQHLLDCRNANVTVTLAGLPDNYKNIMDMVGIGALAPTFETEQLALAAMAREAQ